MATIFKSMVRSFLVLCCLAPAMEIPAFSQDFKFASATGLCELSGESAEESTILRIVQNSHNSDLVEVLGIFVRCETLSAIKKGETDLFLPMYTLQVAKTDGKILPYYTFNFNNLRSKIEEFIDTYNWSDDQEKAAAELQKIIEERQSALQFDLRSTAPIIADYSDKTVSVAQNSSIQIGENKINGTAIVTSTLVEGYLVSATGTDTVESTKDFWRLQLETELLAREIVVMKADPNTAESQGNGGWYEYSPSDSDQIIFVEASNSDLRPNQSPLFVVRCFQNNTSAYVFFRTGAKASPGAFGRVVLSSDGNMRRDTWVVSPEGTHAGRWAGREAVPFIRSLIGGRDLEIQLAFQGFPSEPIRFDISGFEGALLPIRKRCNW